MVSHKNFLRIFCTMLLFFTIILIYIEYLSLISQEQEFFSDLFIFYLCTVVFFLVIFGLMIVFDNDYREWIRLMQIQYPIRTNILIYCYTLIIASVLVYILFNNITPILGDSDSSRYFFSALAQIQAATVSIIITLTLIAVQLVATTYTSQVTKIFKKLPDMWILLAIFIFSIFFDIFILKSITSGITLKPCIIPSIWEQQIFIFNISLESTFITFLAILFGAFSFLALFPYIWNMLTLLYPDNLMDISIYKLTPNYNWDDRQYLQLILNIMIKSADNQEMDRLYTGLNLLNTNEEKLLHYVIGRDDDMYDKYYRIYSALILIQNSLKFKESREERLCQEIITKFKLKEKIEIRDRNIGENRGYA